jgi:hypothetical protein
MENADTTEARRSVADTWTEAGDGDADEPRSDWIWPVTFVVELKRQIPADHLLTRRGEDANGPFQTIYFRQKILPHDQVWAGTILSSPRSTSTAWWRALLGC